jgi:hypothetical protein
VLQGSPFFRHLGPLHSSRMRSMVAHVLAASGAGHAGMSMLHRVRTRASFDRRFAIAPAVQFDDWADQVWRETSEQYSFSAVRDSNYLRFLYRGDQLAPTRLDEAGKPRGWTQLMHCKPKNASFFGGMRVMALVDGAATRAAVPSLVLAAVEQARQEKADLLFSNQMHGDWTEGLRSCGFLQGPSNYLLALSKGLMKLLDPLSDAVSRIHFNRGDGDGRVNLMG